jgi:hypothetical protein
VGAEEEEEEDGLRGSEADTAVEWIGVVVSGELGVMEDALRRRRSAHNVCGRRERDRYMDYGGGDAENQLTVWVLR